MKQIVWVVAIFILSSIKVMAQVPDGVGGFWKTIDDDTQQEASIVRVEVVNQRLQATVVKLLADPPDSICEKCTDYRKNKPIIGMKIMDGLTQNKSGYWTGGEILDPDNGKTYRVQVTVRGDQLIVRGYLGISLFGREQIWSRVASP